jgi:hypothetical protein
MLLEGLGKLGKSNDLIGNITRDLRGYELQYLRDFI